MTPKQQECLDAIRRLTVQGVSPSYDELMLALGLNSKSGVHRLVHGLAERGHIVIVPGRRRMIQIAPEAVSAAPFDQMARAAMEHIQHRLSIGLSPTTAGIRGALVSACAGGSIDA